MKLKDKKPQKKNLVVCFIGINPDKENFNIFKEISKISRHIKISTKTSLTDDLLRLLEFEFKSNHSIKSKCLKWIVKKIMPRYEKHTIKNKTDKNWKGCWV